MEGRAVQKAPPSAGDMGDGFFLCPRLGDACLDLGASICIM